MNAHTVSLRLDDDAWEKLHQESRRTGIQPGPLARSYVLAALEAVELLPQDQRPAVRQKPSAKKRSNKQQPEPASLPGELLPPGTPKKFQPRGGPTRDERRSNKSKTVDL